MTKVLGDSEDLLVKSDEGPLLQGDRISNVSNHYLQPASDVWLRAKFDERNCVYVGVSSRMCHNMVVDVDVKMVARSWLSFFDSSFCASVDGGRRVGARSGGRNRRLEFTAGADLGT